MNDTVGLLLIRLPITPMSEQNVAPLIARLNGEQEALNESKFVWHKKVVAVADHSAIPSQLPPI
jgi:hypothetical protein